MLIPAFFLNCVVAIGDLATTLTPGAPPHKDWQTFGTGFFYGYLTQDNADPAKRQFEVYLVTARHVVANRQSLKIRVNPQAAGAAGQEFEIPSSPPPGEATWFFHPDPAIDIAAVSINFNQLTKTGFDVNFFQQNEHAVTRSQMQERQMAAGDGVYASDGGRLA